MNFQQTLKAIYKKHNTIAPLIEGLEGEIPQQTLDDYYVKLKTIIKEDDDKKQGNYETISGQKREVEMENIFSEPSIRRLLILGGAGVGKSTLMQYMAYRWSQDSLWNDKFDFVYRVPLKILLSTGWEHAYDINQRQDELKCLIHHNLVSQGAGGGCKLEDMPWLEKKDKILLLLDGYDEVAHERNGNFKGLFESIFKHENIILTSRPNAVDKQMAEKFGKKIENTGLDSEGIKKYLNQYFKDDQEKGEALQEFLDKNSSIKEICHIPVNIAMLCFIWSEGDSNSALHEISNMSDLYKQVVDHLGFRYHTKSNPKQSKDELMSQWKGGEIHLDELQVLEYTAYKAMTGGGIQVPNDQRVETLIIKGMTKKGDKQGISIQSSINYLAEKLSKSMPTINKVYKYGLMKPEGAVIDAAPKKQPSETDLQEQSFSFIHLSFQEFLTAFYFVKSLLKANNKEEQEIIANFIAQHRNEPRYLMTLKLMAGLLSAQDEDNTHAEQAIKIFWDAILCNPDGVLELGVEAKVTLLVHLLGQAKKEDTIDKRIPNLKIAIDLIDSAVLQDLARWGSHLKDSDYISPNIKEGLLQCLIKDNKSWVGEISPKLQEKFTKKIKKTSPITLEVIVEIISFLINKFSRDEQNKIFTKLIQLIKNHNEETWQFTKHTLETLILINQKSKLDLEDNNPEKEELLNVLLLTAYDENLTLLSLKAIKEILNIAENLTLIDKVKANIKEDKFTLKTGTVIQAKGSLIKLVPLDDLQFIKDVINTSFVPFLQDPLHDVRILASNTIAKIVIHVQTDKQLSLETINLLLPLLKDPEVRDSVSENLKTLVDVVGAHQLIQDRINKFPPLPREPVNSMITSAPGELSQLIRIKGGSIDSQLVCDFMDKLIQSHTYLDTGENHFLFNRAKEVIHIVLKSDSQTARDVINTLLPLYKHGYARLGFLAFSTNAEIIKTVSNNDKQFMGDIISLMTSLLQDSSPLVSEFASRHLREMTKGNIQLRQKVFEILTPLLENSQIHIRNSAFGILDALAEKNIQGGAQKALGLMIPLLKSPDKQVVLLALAKIGSLLKNSFASQTQLITEVIMKVLIPHFQDPKSDIRGQVLGKIAALIPILRNKDIPFLQDLTKIFIPFLTF